MRLTCPACGACYAPPEGSIPAEGRMVRCSDCRAEWRARPDGATAAAPPSAAPSAPPAPTPTRAPDLAPARAETLAATLDAEPAASSRGGFMAGFAVVALAALAALGLYLNHEAAAAAVPQMAGPIARFVAFVDMLRAEIAQLAAGLR